MKRAPKKSKAETRKKLHFTKFVKAIVTCPHCGCFFTEASKNYIADLQHLGLSCSNEFSCSNDLLIAECKFCTPGSEHYSERQKYYWKIDKSVQKR